MALGGRQDQQLLLELHRDLARKYRLHKNKINDLWRAFTPAQRAKAMRAGAADGVVLKHSLDPALGVVCNFLPEWNLEDVAGPDPEFFLRLVEHRASTSLAEQYIKGFNDRPGDYELIMGMMQTRNLRHQEPFRDCYTFFMDDKTYGKSFKILKNKEETLRGFAPAIAARLCIPQATGELILTRQTYLLQCLNIIVEDILEEGSATKAKAPPAQSSATATAAFSKLSIQPAATKLDISALRENARDQRDEFDDNLTLTRTQPDYLAHVVNNWFFSRPELVPDERGRMLPAHTDRYISAAIMDTVDNAVKTTAIWNFIVRLLELLADTTDKTPRAMILQELSNMCHFEYTRAQAWLKRHMATGDGMKRFKRVSGARDNGNPRILVKGNPETLEARYPQLYYMLRLCQLETNATKAVDWLKKLEEWYRTNPAETSLFDERIVNAVGDLAVIVGFIQSLSASTSMPAFNRKKAQRFVSGLGSIETELNQTVKPDLDLTDFAVPIDNLVEPGMAEGALKALDAFVTEKMGTKLGFLYADLIDGYLERLQEQLQVQAQKDTLKDAPGEYIPFPAESSSTPEVRVQQRRQKEKTRPAHSSIYDIIAPAEAKVDDEGLTRSPPAPKPFKVKAATAGLFSTLFGEARGSISWSQFEAAFVELGFSIIPKFGSVYTFIPSKDMPTQKPLTLHRPHQSQIERYRQLYYASRLNRLYGWGADTFQTD